MAMKDIIHENVSLSDVDMILNFAAENGIAIDTYEGVLNDTHIIFADKNIKIGRAKPREYIVCYYKFQNSNSNTLHILQTDNLASVESFIPADYDEELYV